MPQSDAPDTTVAPDNNPTFVEAASGQIADVADAAGEADQQLNAAGLEATVSMVGKTATGMGAVGGAVQGAGSRLAVTFADVDAMTESILALNRFTAPVIGSVARLASDPDLVGSLVLSPITGANAEAAVLGAAARLTTELAVAEALTLVMASVVTTYQLADSALSTSAAALGAGGDLLGAFTGGLWEVAGALVDLKVASVRLPLLAGGAAAVAAGSFAVGAVAEAGDALGGIFTGRGYSMNDVWANTAGNLQGVLGSTGPYFDDILSTLIHDGHTIGWFHDGETKLVSAESALVSEYRIGVRASTSAQWSHDDIYGDGGVPFTFQDGKITPTDSASMAASLKQIDTIGAHDMGVIRVFTVLDPNGVPVRFDGFSLGGITAAAIAQNPDNGYNIDELNTVG